MQGAMTQLIPVPIIWLMNIDDLGDARVRMTLMKLYKPSPRIKAMDIKTCNRKELAIKFLLAKLENII